MERNIVNAINARAALEPRIDFPSLDDIVNGVKDVFNDALGDVTDTVNKVESTVSGIEGQITSNAKEQFKEVLGQLFLYMLLAQLLVIVIVAAIWFTYKFFGKRIVGCVKGRSEKKARREQEEGYENEGQYYKMGPVSRAGAPVDSRDPYAFAAAHVRP